MMRKRIKGNSAQINTSLPSGQSQQGTEYYLVKKDLPKFKLGLNLKHGAKETKPFLSLETTGRYQ